MQVHTTCKLLTGAASASGHSITLHAATLRMQITNDDEAFFTDTRYDVYKHDLGSGAVVR